MGHRVRSKYNVLNMKHITRQNIEDKLDSMKKMIQIWLHRNIMPIGRICIAKSLILSKITHILQALPTPDHEYLNSIEKLLLDFIWKNKPHEINAKLLCKDIKHAGLAMLDIYEFDMGLKLTWIRKMEKDNPDWLGFAKTYKIDILKLTDEKYHQILYNSTINPFWKSVILAYKKWYINTKRNIKITPAQIHLWGNPEINIPFNKDLFTNGIIY